MSKATPILLVGTTQTCPDLEYVSGFRAPDPIVCLVERARRDLIVGPLEHGRALKRSGPNLHVWTPATLGLRGLRARRLSGWCRALLARRKMRAVTVDRFFPVGIAQDLQKSGVRVHVSVGPLFPRRAVKSAAETGHIRRAQQAAVIAMRHAIALIDAARPDSLGILRREGKILTAEWVRAQVRKLLLDHNCTCDEVIVAPGKQAADPHETGHGPIRAEETIVIDIFPHEQDHGYWGDLTRTVVWGRAPSVVRRMYAAVRAAQHAALDAIRPGITGRTVHVRAAATLRKHGFENGEVNGVATGFTHGTGHGVGLAIHEAPSLSSGGTRLSAGNVVTVEPGLYYPDIGGIRIEDTVLVTPGGWKYLVPCEKRLEIGLCQAE